jgi:chromosome segregation protein
VSDIVEELDRRMGTLRRQSQKAERFRKYRAEQRDLELWKASHRLLELAAEASMVGGRLDEARVELDTVRVDFDTRDAAAVAERAELALEERRLAGIQEEVYELDNQLQLAQEQGRLPAARGRRADPACRGGRGRGGVARGAARPA